MNEILENEKAIKRKSSGILPKALLSMLLLWLAFPPVGLWLLAWVSLIPVLHIANTCQQFNRRQYFQIWLAGLAYWMATLYFVPIPHPALWLGWLVISVYLACYLPVFVFSTQSLCMNFRVPFVVAAPICWTGLEFIRNHLFTGMGLACLSHTQFRQPLVLQVSDLAGAYTLTFVIVLVNCSLLLTTVVRKKTAGAMTSGLVGAVTLILVLIYGWRTIRDSSPTFNEDQHIHVGIIQGSMDTNLLASAQEYREFLMKKSAQYVSVNQSALQEWDNVDLILWPENGWPYPDLHPDTNQSLMSIEEIEQYEYAHYDAVASLFVTGRPTPHYLVGALTYDPVENESRGSAILIDKEGTIQNRYYKNHLVMFGEYTPLADWFPALKKIPAVGKGLVAGSESITVNINEIHLMPNICFESTVPHYVRSQVQSLAEQGTEPDVLVNLTNDGWFYGTSCLDFHLACNVFRSIEMRKPNLVCANTGLSAHIDKNGQIIEEGPRRKTGYILATVGKHDTISLYRAIGDSVSIAMAAFTILALLLGCFKKHAD